MPHPLHRVTAFAIVAPYTLRVGFEDHTHQIIDFRPILAGIYMVHCVISMYLIKFNLTQKSTRLSGPMEPTLILPPFMIGRFSKKR